MTTLSISLPDQHGLRTTYRLEGKPVAVVRQLIGFNRVALSAAHVVADPMSAEEPGIRTAIDWDRTIAFRRHILDLGLGIAEAMDTAQRGMGLDWDNALKLIGRTLSAASSEEKQRIYSGVGTDHLDPADPHSLDDVTAAYLQQIEAVQKLDGRLIVMASRALARVASSPRDYKTVYRRVLSACDRPVILHWLGDMFDPALKGYWGGDGFEQALETAFDIIDENAHRIDGIKISLLDNAKEIAMRRRLPKGVKMYTGDDFNYPDLIVGDEQGFSHALLGIFDPIAPVASAALAALAAEDRETYEALMGPTVPLSRLIFRAPTQYYKTGVVFLAWLNGFQDHFIMVGGAQSMRPLPYFTEIFKSADKAGLLREPELAAFRMKSLLTIYGFDV